MKKLPLESSQYRYLEKDFKRWLDILGYAEITVCKLPMLARELLHYLEQRQITSIRAVKAKHIYDFVRYLKQRPNQATGGALSNSSINHIIYAVNAFARYLSANGHHHLDIHPRRLENTVEERIILSKAEIKALYEASFIPSRESTTALGQRDRAILAIFYGCGLRKNEGYHLNTDDIRTGKGLVLVRKGKMRKERFVPVAGRHLEDIQRYLEEGRQWFLEDHQQSAYYSKTGRKAPKKKNTDPEAFFLSQTGKRMGESGFYYRLKRLKERTGIEKDFGLHNLRHSIATHLLQAGMEIEEIRRFLGHSTLESTQIYTHIVNEIKKQEQYERDQLLHIPVE